MKVDIYTSSTNGGKHLAVPAGTDLKSVLFPTSLDKDLHRVSPLRATIDTKDPGYGINIRDLEVQVETKGFAVFGRTVEINVFAAGR
jgi:hypothetical protein